LVAHGIQLLCSMNLCKKRFHSYFVRWWILEWSRCSCWSCNMSRSCKTAIPGLGVERKRQQQQEVCEKVQLTFIVAMYSWCERLKNLFILDSCLSTAGPSNPVSAPRRTLDRNRPVGDQAMRAEPCCEDGTSCKLLLSESLR
jgi:hypothetical protein